MNEILLNYIVQAILGGASGYITNDYAINMLFKEYTPLKLGGVIKKTRIEFIENLSSMVENDIINKEKLHEIFNSHEFKVKFEKLTCDFYENCLYEAVNCDKFSDIDGFDTTMSKTDIYVQEILNENIESLIGLIAGNFDAGCFLTKLQSENITESVYASVKEIIVNTDIFEDVIKYFYENNKELKLCEIFGSNIPAIDNSINKLAEIATDNADSSEILSGFNSAANDSLNIFYNKQIKNVIKLNNKQASAFITYMTENDIVYKLCRSLLSYGKTIDKSLYSIIDPAFESSLKTYIKKNLPYITEQLVSYVQKNSVLIDRIIEDSIDEVVNESEGLKAKLLHAIKNTYFNNLSKKYSVVDKIILYIRQFTEPEKLSIDISKKIIERLDTITVSDIIIEAESNFNVDKAYDIVAAFLNKNAAAILENIENYISKLHVKDILPMFDLTAEKILSSQLTQNLLKNKSQDYYVKVLLSKELNKLLAENKSDTFVKRTADYLKVKFIENEKPIKSFISKKIKDIEIDKNYIKSKELSEFICKESYDKYKEEASKLKNINLSSALDKLNSIENISKNSSETFRKYMINNTDAILKGSIKGIVTDNLNKLSDDELVKFANDFIGRELKPIMFFGGVLGVIAGLILAAFQNSPLDPAEINIANMATYAFVGFITNVIAINMIFKPYREIKSLSKIPFLRNFSLGYIIKNQKNFSISTAHYIDTSLLSKKSINELFEKHKDSIKQSFIKSIAENDYATLSSLLVKNKESTIKGTYSFLKNNILKNLSALSNYLYEKISQTKLAVLLTDQNISSLSNFASESLKTNNLSNRIYSVISSDKKLNNLFSTDFFIKFFNDKFVKLYDKAINYLKPDIIKNQILQHNDKFKQYANKSIEEVFNQDNISGFSEKVNKTVFSEGFRNNVSLAAVGLFNKLFDRNKTFGELFDGKVKTYIDENLPQILENTTQKIKDNLAESKSIVSASLRAEFKAHLGFIESGLYAIMDGDEIIDHIVGKIMTDKLPLFMNVKENEINKIMAELVNEKFYKTQIEALYANLNKLQINEVVENYLIANKEKLEAKIDNFIIELYNKIKYKNLNSILELFNLSDLEGFIEVYESEINGFTDAMRLHLIDNKDEISKETSSYISSVTEEFMNLKFSDIFNNETQDDIDRIIKNTTDILYKNGDMKKIIESFIEAYREYYNNTYLNYYIDKDEFASSTETFVQNLLMNEETEKTVKQILYTVINEAAGSNFDIIDSKSKEYIVNIFVDSSIEALKRNLDDILKSVEFDKIAAEEIEKMEPKKIHQMFNSFGEKYFRKLMLYGFGGFIFGINMYVGFSLTGLKILSETLKMGDFADGE
ncbi:MAG: DUF445 family protein [Tissierellia bacterium]|nr:DUF445 family protein [Tissierellia bacterium]